MKFTPKNIKRTLRKIINELSAHPEIYAKNLGKDFSRNRKLPFKQMVYSILSMAGKSLPNELMVLIYMCPLTSMNRIHIIREQMGKNHTIYCI